MLAATLVAALAARSPFGGPVYTGRPDVATTSALVLAGGGGKVYSARRALNAILGVELLDPEVMNLQKHYGTGVVASWMRISTYVVKDALRPGALPHAHLPLPTGALVGKRLAKTLVADGTGRSGAFWTGLWLDKLFSHAVHVRVMHDVDTHFGRAADATYHRINNQAMYDIDHQIGGSAGLAAFH
ncbi:MAG: hypothetical protein M3R44_08490 [Candidatus Eremiobacteraeota bacterium]|nr:hypothetical protein [Candidatus Eremiobacteraeota bacterium]